MKFNVIGTILAMAMLGAGCNNTVPADMPRASATGADDESGMIDGGGVDDGTGRTDDTGGTDDTGDANDASDTGDVYDTHDTGDAPDGPIDLDGDGVSVEDGDCDDLDDRIHPGALELCDGLDNDCDDVIDPATAVDASVFYADADADGYGDAESGVSACAAPEGYVADSSDCDDADSATNPGATELCDLIDNDCDGEIDNDADVVTWYADNDRDGYGDPNATQESCSEVGGFVTNGDDCNDADADTHPGAEERCDRVDRNCDGSNHDDAVDASFLYVDNDGDGYGQTGTGELMCEPLSGYSWMAADCDDTDPMTNPGATEYCDGVDNDCDGSDAPGVATMFGSKTKNITAHLTGTAGAPAEYSLEDSGTLRICEGIWYVNLTVDVDDLLIEGVGNADDVVLSGGWTASSASMAGESVPVTAGSIVNELTVRNLTLANGSTRYTGGCLGADASTVYLEGVTIRDCWASGDGGGVGIHAGNLEMTDSSVMNNSTAGDGGGIYVNGAVIIERSSLSENTAHRGGAVAIDGGSFFDDVTFFENTVDSDGGAIYATDGDLDGIDLDIRRNTADENGGGIYLFEGVLDIYTSTISSNDARHNGGGVAVYRGDATLTGTAVVGNSAHLGGGGIYQSAGDGATLTLLNSYIHENTAELEGGGVSIISTGSTASLVCSGAGDGLQGFLANQSTGGSRSGGLYISGSSSSVGSRGGASSSIDSRGCDWGGGEDDNASNDIGAPGFWADVDVVDYPIFVCEGSSCSGDVSYSAG